MTAHEKLNVALTEKLILSTADFDTHNKDRSLLSNRDLCLDTIYHNTGSHPLWVTASGPESRAAIILEFLKNADSEGLDTRQYDTDEIVDLWQTKNPASLARLDLLLTYNLIRYIHDISFGRLHPLLADQTEFFEKNDQDFDVLSAIQSALAATNLKEYLTSLAPSHHYYRNLITALKVYRKIASSGGWQKIPPGKTLHPGDKDARVVSIYNRLLSPGIPKISPPVGNIYGKEMQKAVKVFQRLHGIEDDGIIGPQTLAIMNIPASRLVEQIIVNLARWRWQAHVLGEKYVMINIANFTLTAFNHKAMILNFPVIIGELQHQTPVFSSNITYIEFNPYWNITPSIAKNEELPNLRKNPHYLIDRHVQLFSDWGADAVELDSTKIDWSKITRSQIAGFRLRQEPWPLECTRQNKVWVSK